MNKPFFLILILTCGTLFFLPVSGLTVSGAPILKWDAVDVHGPVTHQLTISGNDTSTVIFSDNLQGICSADPATVKGSGTVTLQCDPSESVVGYARISEPSTQMIQSGVRIPIALSTNDKPATETPMLITTITSASPTINQATTMKAPVQEQQGIPVSNPADYSPEWPFGFYGLILAGCMAAVFIIVIVYDHRRGRKP